MTVVKSEKVEFGDFQTPPGLAREVCSVIARTGFMPATVIEPTCGRGNLLLAAIQAFPQTRYFFGNEQNRDYATEATAGVGRISGRRQVEVRVGDFFETDWEQIIGGLPKPLLVVGNPPWVTNATLGTLGSNNLPEKVNTDNLRGIDALTGRSNFDISESMLRQNLQWLDGSTGMLAVLCKTAVARKVLTHAWSNGLAIASADLHRIDALAHFGASVDACLLVVRFQPGDNTKECSDYGALHATNPSSVFGLREGTLVADVHVWDRRRNLIGLGLSGWRSGIKHDCSAVFELIRTGDKYQNGMGHTVEVEDDVLYPLLKSSDLARERSPRKWMLVPQKSMSSSPETLAGTAPQAWRYLLTHTERLAQRRSAIYRNRPRFSIFGVGDYSFAPWKVAIAGLYKRLTFVKVAPLHGRPVVFDDTCYGFSCASQEECDALYDLVQSEPAQEFWSAFVFWDAKRPITAQLLNLLDLASLARILGNESRLTRILADRQVVAYEQGSQQRLLFNEPAED